ncbi:tetratricopeptide repeat protein [Nocardia amamiensis]|uniref:tetratricopeptide repeat protein n=1 Tax=Nocardia amamiensis TaxID=404578 RepID=UPI0033E2FF87
MSARFDSSSGVVAASAMVPSSRFSQGRLCTIGGPAALNNLGNGYFATGEYGQATDLHQQALDDLHRDIGHRLGKPTPQQLCDVRRITGEYEQATDMYQQALALYLHIGNRLGKATVLNNLICMREADGKPIPKLGLYGGMFRKAIDQRNTTSDRLHP